ncbi:MAG: methyl-accepting chemotaxis protein [Desulfarculaceae bacterium]|jgi:methyl-accepting chemotaxis protein
MRNERTLTLSTQIVVSGIIGALFMAFVIGFMIFKFQDRLYAEKKLKTQHLVETVAGIVEYYQDLEKKGQLKKDQAQKQAMQALKKLRYEGDQYFWINDYNHRMIMHPIQPKLDGQDMSGFEDPTGKKLFVEMVDLCRQNPEGGFIDYYWPKPGHSDPVKKISFIKGFPTWEWLIGTGIYVDDVSLGQVTYSFGILALLGILLLLFLSMLMARRLNKSLSGVIGGLLRTAHQTASASGQIESASQNLAEGASEQAASLEQTSSSLEEMAAMTQDNADNARKADSLMSETQKVVEQANASMRSLHEAMGQINQASDETAKIIKTIDEIAFQTNLLALNAAVEAARAGEAGAGFAVVADEVRNLAMRAAEAAKNTQELIARNIDNIKNGLNLVTETDETFQHVSQSTEEVAGLLAQIADASGEQAQGIEGVNLATSEMDKITQQVAANAEQTATSSRELSSHSGVLLELVSRLQVLSKIRDGADGSKDDGEQDGESRHADDRLLISPKQRPPARKNPTQSAALSEDDDFKDF